MGISIRAKVNVSTEIWERGGGGRVCDGEGLETACLRPALSWFIDQYDFMVTVLKSEDWIVRTRGRS